MRRSSWALAVAAVVVCAPGASAWAAEPAADLEGTLEKPLRDAIELAIGQVDQAPANRFEARRRASDAGESAIAVLRSEGYYAYDVEVDVGEGDRPRPMVTVTPGPRFLIADPKVAWSGAAPVGDARLAGEQAMGLAIGAAGRSADILNAEGRIVASIEKRGYADAAVEPREVVVDHADRSVRPTFHIAAGDLVHLDGIDLAQGEGRTRRAWIEALAPWKAGDVYDPDKVAEMERRLRDTGVYDSVTVALDPPDKATPDGRRPVLISLADRAPHTIEASASYSTSEGAGLNGSLILYNRFHRADTTTLTATLATLEQKLDAQIALPDWRRAQQTLTLGGAIYNETTDAYNEAGFGVRADLTHRYTTRRYFGVGGETYVTVGATLDVSRTHDNTTVALANDPSRTLLIGTVLGAFALDKSNDPLNPTKGWRLQARVEPTAITGDSNLAYLKATTQGTAYLPVTASTVLAGRLNLGGIFGGVIPTVPAGRRFFAGGGGSVRGYSFQAVGPRLADNTPQGGLSLFESSLEVRQRISQSWGLVGFVDAGAVGTHPTPSAKDFSAGVGFGVRYDLGFGPLRADIAVPLSKRQGDPSFQIYLSIGQSF